MTNVDVDITTWIRSTMTPEIASWALVLTPGARWHIAPENLVGRDAEFQELRELITKWDTKLWLREQFARLHADGNTATQDGAYDEVIAVLAVMEYAIDQKITEFGS